MAWKEHQSEIINPDVVDVGLGSSENRFRRRANRFKPAADIHLGVGFATEMTGGGRVGGGQIPLDNRKFLISAFDDKPMDWIVTDDATNLALEFFQTGHAFSVERCPHGLV